MTQDLPPIRIYNADGRLVDESWMRDRYGDVQITRTKPLPVPTFRLIELREATGLPHLVATVLGEDGAPMPAVPVVRHWPGAPLLPPWQPPADRWFDYGVIAPTDTEGKASFAMGEGDYYDPNTQSGASALWVALTGAPCDLIAHLGMLAGTDAAHLNPTFQRFPYQPPEPEPGPYDAAAEALETIAHGYQDLAAVLRGLSRGNRRDLK